MHKSDVPKAQKLLNDTAKEMQLTLEELDEELMPFLEDRYLDRLPSERVTKALSDLKRVKERYMKKSNPQGSPEHAEGEGRQMRKVNVNDALKEARTNEDTMTRVLSQIRDNQRPSK